MLVCCWLEMAEEVGRGLRCEGAAAKNVKKVVCVCDISGWLKKRRKKMK